MSHRNRRVLFTEEDNARIRNINRIDDIVMYVMNMRDDDDDDDLLDIDDMIDHLDDIGMLDDFEGVTDTEIREAVCVALCHL